MPSGKSGTMPHIIVKWIIPFILCGQWLKICPNYIVMNQLDVYFNCLLMTTVGDDPLSNKNHNTGSKWKTCLFFSSHLPLYHKCLFSKTQRLLHLIRLESARRDGASANLFKSLSILWKIYQSNLGSKCQSEQ